MIKPFLVWMAPVGSLLMLAFQSLVPYQMMSAIGESMRTDSTGADVGTMAPVGAVGAVIFGLGMICLTLLKRKPSAFARLLLAFAALLIFAGSVSNLGGDWRILSAFRDLATAQSIDADKFIDSVRPAKPLILIGHGLLLAASIGVALAATKMPSKARRAGLSFVVATISYLVLLLTVLWGQTSMASFAEIIASESIEPSVIAACFRNVLFADVLFQGSLLGFSLSTLLVAVGRRSVPATD